MKAVVEVSPPNHTEGVQSGRVTKRRDVENEEVQMYISKLKDLVPFIPKNRRVSKVEVIEHVIQYICDLQYTLESRRSAKVDSAELVARLQGDVTNNVNSGNNRQPLGTLAPSPNTIVRSTAPSPPTVLPETTRMSPTELDKTQDSDVRPISC